MTTPATRRHPNNNGDPGDYRQAPARAAHPHPIMNPEGGTFIVTRPLVSEPAEHVVSRAHRRHTVRRPNPSSAPARSDVVAALRSELQAVFERLDAYLADQPPASVVALSSVAVDQPDPFEGLPALISVGKAAAILGLSRATAYRLAETKELPVQRMGGRVYVVTARLRATFGGTA